MNSLQVPLQNSLNPYLSGVLDAYLDEVKLILNNFLGDPQFAAKVLYAFGNTVDLDQAASSIANFAQTLPTLNIRPEAEINFAKGAYAGAIDSIFLAEEFLNNNSHNQAEIIKVILEETGHALDWELNDIDPIWDEGELFASIVTQPDLYEIDFQRIPEDDKAIAIIDGYTVEIEQATLGINPAFDLIGLTQLRNDPRFAGIDGSGFSVAVLDTGLDATHPLINPNFITFADFVEGRTTAYDSGTHGTHVAGTVGARDENIGVAPDSGLIGIRAIGTFAATRDALQWVLDNRNQHSIVAVNMSLGVPDLFLRNNAQIEANGGTITQINDIINRLERAGVTVVSSAGNSYFSQQVPGVSFPAISSTINVGSVWQSDFLSETGRNQIGWRSGAIDFITQPDIVVSHSQRLDDPNDIYDTLFAPGAMIKSTVPINTDQDGDGLEGNGGTSQASPHVAGAVALMQEAAFEFGGRLLTPDEVKEILFSTADTITDNDGENDNVTNTNTSYQRLNIFNAISEIQRRFNEMAPPPPEGGAGDANGTIMGAYRVPTVLNGSPVDVILGSIGTDGGTTQVGDKDVDIFRFEVAVPGTVVIDVGSHPNNPNDFDTLLRLFDSTGNVLDVDDDGGTGRFSSLEVFLNPGVYYAGVSGYNNGNYDPNVAGSGVEGATGNYAIQFSLGNTDLNGLLANAVDISLGNDLDPYDLAEGSIGFDYGNFVGANDVDLFRVIVPDNGILNIDIDTPFESVFVDSYLRIFEEDGSQAFFDGTNIPIVSDDNLSVNVDGFFTEFTDINFPNLVFEDPIDRSFFYGHTTDSFIAGGVERGEVYYIGVSDFANQNYNTQDLSNRPTNGTGGLYNLIVQFLNNDRNGSIAQALTNVPPNTTNQPGTIGVDTDPQTQQVFEVGDLDVDFVKINSPTAGILEIDIDSYENTNFNDPVDTVLLIFDSEGNLLAENDDTNGLDPLLQYEIEANTDYFVAVAGYGNSNFDPFSSGSGSSGDTGRYIFNSRVQNTSQVVGTLSNNLITYPAVETVDVGSTIFANIGEDNDFFIGPTDIDIYRFVPNFSGDVQIRTTAFEAFSADTYLRFFDANGVQIAANDDQSNLNRGSFLEVPVTAGRTYYIGVNGSSSQAGNYNPLTGAGVVAGNPGSQGDYTLTITQSQSFDPALYLASNPDLIRAFGYNLEAATRHYIENGSREGRQSDLFLPERYLEVYPDLQAVFGNDTNAAIRHYIENGYSEGRDFLTGFEPGAYIASYQDLTNAFGYNLEAGRQHYLKNGYYEGRLVTFDPDDYIASHPDLIVDFGYNLQAATQHYINFGASENRVQDNFDEVAYLNKYSDLQNAFGNDLVAATRHYIQSGYFEGRSDLVT